MGYFRVRKKFNYLNMRSSFLNNWFGEKKIDSVKKYLKCKAKQCAMWYFRAWKKFNSLNARSPFLNNQFSEKKINCHKICKV